jgi:hypothetical protein
MEAGSSLDGLLGEDEPHATLRDACLVSVSLDYRNNEAVAAWEVCIGNPDDSTRGARDRRRPGRLVFSGLLFWVIDPPKALDARPGLPRLNGDGPLSRAPTSRGRRLARLIPAGASGWYFFFSSWNAYVYCGATRVTYEWV